MEGLSETPDRRQPLSVEDRRSRAGQFEDQARVMRHLARDLNRWGLAEVEEEARRRLRELRVAALFERATAENMLVRGDGKGRVTT